MAKFKSPVQVGACGEAQQYSAGQQQQEQESVGCWTSNKSQTKAARPSPADRLSLSPENVSVRNNTQEVAKPSNGFQNAAGRLEPKWWRSCWNGAQLDGELLYKTVKAQQERRLASAAAAASHKSAPQLAATTSSSQSCVYAVPRRNRPQTQHHLHQATASFDSHRQQQPRQQTTKVGPATARKSATTLATSKGELSDEVDEQNPLNDPLYASVLGTSKQLRAINNKLSSCPPDFSTRPCGEVEEDLQVCSLVERCLEVQRAFQTNGRNLLLKTTTMASSCGGAATSRESTRSSCDDSADEETTKNCPSSLLAEEQQEIGQNDDQQEDPGEQQQRRRMKLLHLSPASGGASDAAGAAKQTGGRTGGSNEERDRLKEQHRQQQPPPPPPSDTAAANLAGSDFGRATPTGGARLDFSSRRSSEQAAECRPAEQLEGPSFLACADSGNEIVVDSSVMAQSSGEQTTIRVRAIGADGAGAEDAREEKKSREETNFRAASSGAATTCAEPIHNLSATSVAAGVATGHQQQLHEAATSNNLVKFFTHYKGENWRTRQLAHQIPHQDIKLLTPTGPTLSTSGGTVATTAAPNQQIARSNSTLNSDLNNNNNSNKEQDTATTSDEIDFIRGQRKMASQFKASLYYLSPRQQQQVPAQQVAASAPLPKSSKSSNKLRRSSADIVNGSAAADLNHCCLKCKKTIEVGTTCVRVDNLQLNQKQHRLPASEFRTCRRNSSQTNIINSKLEVAISCANKANQQQAVADCDSGTMTTQMGKSANGAEEKSSSDEGLGSGSSSGTSSAQSSTAGSHCDDRETPPHVEAVVGLSSPSNLSSPGASGRSGQQRNKSANGEKLDAPATAQPSETTSTTFNATQQLKHCSYSCDNLKLSFDSLNISSKNNRDSNGFPSCEEGEEGDNQKQRTSCNNLEFQRDCEPRSSRQTALTSKEDASANAKKRDGKTRKSRTLTWSASLGSLGASLRFGGGQSQQRCSGGLKLEHSPEVSSSSGGGNSDKQLQQAADEQKEIATKTVLFHTDCFCCATCNEILVDLRALIYVNDPATMQWPRKANQETNNCSDSEYVNLPNDASDEERDDEQEWQRQQQQINLYCHRHFVELFKPRCQQCDCLILDEECTEAEGKVWHIKHFCCTDCKAPLGGHQYIIVDQTLTQARRKQQQGTTNLLGEQHAKLTTKQGNANANDAFAATDEGGGQLAAQNSPYCLKCFDRIFGETCEQCGQLITCDSGAINHEARSWHASAACFKCRRCAKSLLSAPFLPSHDGFVYCSVNCSEMAADSSTQSCTTSSSATSLSVAKYCDPNSLPTARLDSVAKEQCDSDGFGSSGSGAPAKLTFGNSPSSQRSQGGLVRHKQLIDYLLVSARSDETSYQLLNYLYAQFATKLSEEKSRGSGALSPFGAAPAGSPKQDGVETKLIVQIGETLRQIDTARKTSSASLFAGSDESSNNKSQFSSHGAANDGGKIGNPFLIESCDRNKQAQSVMSYLLMDRAQLGVGGERAALTNYINIDCLLDGGNKPAESTRLPLSKQLVVGSTVTAEDGAPQTAQLQRNGHNLMRQSVSTHKNFASGGSPMQPQCSPVASLISNEGTISDANSASSSGVSTGPPVGSVNGSIKSHSPLSSTSSHSSVSSSVSSAAAAHQQQAAHPQSATTNSSQCSQQAPNGGSSSSGRSSSQATFVPPTSVAIDNQTSSTQRQHISSITATIERRRRVQPITELSVVDLLTVAEDRMQQHQQLPLLPSSQDTRPTPDGFDQLISHFEANRQRNAQLQQQQPRVPVGSAAQQRPSLAAQLSQSTSGKQQQDSFFNELAQRFPRAQSAAAAAIGVDAAHVNSSEELKRRQIVESGLIATAARQLDTNGLPEMNENAPTASRSQQKNVVTDHYSTVNKANKLRQFGGNEEQQRQQMAAGGSCVAPSAATRDEFFAITAQLLGCQTDTLVAPQQQSHPMPRPASSLSVLSPQQRANEASAVAGDQAAHCSNLQRNSAGSMFGTTQLLDAQQQKPFTRPAKSVSFDPTVKDPPSLTGSMTLGRASALKSALKSTNVAGGGVWQEQHSMLAVGHTMPASLANQLKAGSLSAFSAHYDEFGRRVKLSSLVGHQQASLVEQQEPNRSGKSSLLSNALSLLAGGSSQSSRGGRREERKQRQQALTVQTAQPMSLAQIPPFVQQNQHNMQVQPFDLVDGCAVTQQQQQHLMDMAQTQRHQSELCQPPPLSHQVQRAASSSSVSARERGVRRHPTSRRRHPSSSSSSHSSSRRRRKSSGRRSSRTCCPSRHCHGSRYDEDNYSDESSRCSTCSSGSETDSENDDAASYSSKSDEESDYSTYGDSSGSSYSSSSNDEYDDDGEDPYDSDSSRSSYVTSSSSQSEVGSPGFGSPAAQTSARSSGQPSTSSQTALASSATVTYSSSGRRRSTATSSQRRRDRELTSDRKRDRNTTRRSSRSSKSNRSSASSSSTIRARDSCRRSHRHRHRRDRNQREQRRDHHQSSRRSSSSSEPRNRRHSSRRSIVPSSTSSARARDKLYRNQRHQRDRPAHRRSHSSTSHLEPNEPTAIAYHQQAMPSSVVQQQLSTIPLQLASVNNFHCPSQASIDGTQTSSNTTSRRPVSPSAISTDSKSAANENCRII